MGRTAARRRTDAAIAAAAGLIDKSLLLRGRRDAATRPLYQMLETVRAYAAIELRAAMNVRCDGRAGALLHDRGISLGALG